MTNLITKVMHNGTQYDIGGVTSVNGQTGAVTIPEGKTKIFTLASTSDLTTAQQAYDWYVAGGNPIVKLSGDAGYYKVSFATTTDIRFVYAYNTGASITGSQRYSKYINFSLSSGNVASISTASNSIYVTSTVPTSATNDRITLVI